MTPADPSFVATTLSAPMRRALARAQEDLFNDRAVVTGHGMTIKALRRRRIVTRERPALLTTFGRAVIASDRRDGDRPPTSTSVPASAGETSCLGSRPSDGPEHPRKSEGLARNRSQSASAPTNANP